MKVCVFVVCVCVCVLRGRGKEGRRLIHVQPRNKATVLISKAVIQKCKYGGACMRTNKRGYEQLAVKIRSTVREV